jgi:hypothetical protein
MARTIGPLDSVYDEAEMTALADTVKTYLPNHPNLNVGTLNAIFDSTSVIGTAAVANVTGTKRVVSVVKGIRAEPAIGDPVFCGEFMQSAYNVAGEGGVFVNIPFAGWAADATHRAYQTAWGQLLHTNVSAAAANASGTGVLSQTGASTAFGGYMVHLAVAAGLHVIADSSEADEDLVRSLGAHEIVRRGPDVAARIRTLHPDGVDGLADGSVQSAEVLAAIRDGGAMATVRGWDGPGERGIRIHPVWVREIARDRGRLDDLRRLTEEGRIALRVARTFPAVEAAEAHRVLEAGGTRGRCVIVF